jgi:hypothetical protein
MLDCGKARNFDRRPALKLPQCKMLRSMMLRSKMLRNMSANADYFTPLAHAVASMDRDAYAARFALYDREHKALLRRLATAEEPCSAADVAREEQAFRDAIRRIEFTDEADADDQPTLVPQDEPDEELDEEAPPARAPWTDLRPADLRPSEAGPFDLRPSEMRPPESPEPETFEDASEASIDQLDAGVAVEPLGHLVDLEPSKSRSVVRRVGVRLALAVLFLAAAGTFVWMSGADQEAVQSTSVPGAVEPATPAAANDPTAATASNDPTGAKAQPTWLTPEMFYTTPSLPAPAPTPGGGPALASVPRDIPLPVPRPER